MQEGVSGVWRAQDISEREGDEEVGEREGAKEGRHR